LKGYEDVEQILACIRRAGCRIEEMDLMQPISRRLRRSDATLMSGFPTLLYKEVLRFWKVSTQTIGRAGAQRGPVPVHLQPRHGRPTRMYERRSVRGVPGPGLVMMSVLQNAFANSSSSLVQSKMTGNIIFVLLPPLAYWEFFGAYVLAAVARGMAVGAAVLLVTLPFVEIEFAIRCGSSRSLSPEAPYWARSG